MSKKISFVSNRKKTELVQTKGTTFKSKLAKLVKTAVSNRQRRQIYRMCVRAGADVPAEIMDHFRSGWASVNPVKTRKPYTRKEVVKVESNPQRVLRRIYAKSMDGGVYTGVSEKGNWLFKGGVWLNSTPITLELLNM